MSLDLTALSPEQLQTLKAQLDTLSTPGRSPIRPRQLRDLRLLPTPSDPRPTFFWSADSPRDLDTTKTTRYPKLMWSPEGAEVTVYSDSDESAKLMQGYTLLPMNSIEFDPTEALRAQFDALPDVDRRLLVDAVKAQKISKLQAALSALPEDKLEALLAAAAKPGRKTA